MEEYLTVNDLLKMFKVSRFSIYTWRKNGDLKSYKTPGGRIRFKLSEVEGFLKGK